MLKFRHSNRWAKIFTILPLFGEGDLKWRPKTKMHEQMIYKALKISIPFEFEQCGITCLYVDTPKIEDTVISRGTSETGCGLIYYL